MLWILLIFVPINWIRKVINTEQKNKNCEEVKKVKIVLNKKERFLFFCQPLINWEINNKSKSVYVRTMIEIWVNLIALCCDELCQVIVSHSKG